MFDKSESGQELKLQGNGSSHSCKTLSEGDGDEFALVPLWPQCLEGIVCSRKQRPSFCIMETSSLGGLRLRGNRGGPPSCVSFELSTQRFTTLRNAVPMIDWIGNLVSGRRNGATGEESPMGRRKKKLVTGQCFLR